VGSSSKAPEITTAPTPTSSRETAARIANREPRRSSRSGPFAVGLGVAGGLSVSGGPDDDAAIYLVFVLLAARRRVVVRRNAPARPRIPTPTMPSPRRMPPPDFALDLASAAEIGEVADDATPLHRSAVAVWRDTAALAGDLAAAFFVAALLLVPAFAEAGAVELENTRCVP
jgi:hypothetical protein